MITEQEKQVVDLLAEVWNTFLKINDLCRQEEEEFCYMIHQCQNAIAARSAYREMRCNSYKLLFNDEEV